MTISTHVHDAAAADRTRDGAALWFTFLITAICFEGAGRRFSVLPPALLYFGKDLVLLGGLVVFGITREVRQTATELFGPFAIALPVAFGVTLVQVFNPEQPSIGLGLAGLRCYWLWWLAPLVIASVLSRHQPFARQAFVLGLATFIIAAVAAYQFNLPADDRANSYAWGGEDTVAATVSTTGRVRTSSTFSYLSGFSNFAAIGPALLATLGLCQKKSWLRLWLFGATAALFMTGFMAGSRSPYVYIAITLPFILTPRSLLKVASARWVLIAMALGVTATTYFYGDALQGVFDRFSNTEESADRFELALTSIPPLAALMVDYPALGLGTGMMQSIRLAFGIDWRPWLAEVEPHRILVELGLPGYLLMSVARVGLAYALFRASQRLKAQKKPAFAGLALALIPVGIFGQILMDHVYQALFFLSAGLVLAATVAPREEAY